jgi:hypothetical protein
MEVTIEPAAAVIADGDRRDQLDPDRAIAAIFFPRHSLRHRRRADPTSKSTASRAVSGIFEESKETRMRGIAKMLITATAFAASTLFAPAIFAQPLPPLPPECEPPQPPPNYGEPPPPPPVYGPRPLYGQPLPQDAPPTNYYGEPAPRIVYVEHKLTGPQYTNGQDINGPDQRGYVVVRIGCGAHFDLLGN